MDQSTMSLLMMVGMLVLFYFLLIRPQKKREKKVQEMRSSLKVGDKVITIGGIRGKIVKTGEDFITIEVGSGEGKSLMEISRWGVGTNLSGAEE